MMDASNVAGEKEFWTVEWTTVEARPGEDGRLRVALDNASAVPRGVDEAKLVVVDHPPGVAVAPDILGAVRSYAGPVPPEERDRQERGGHPGAPRGQGRGLLADGRRRSGAGGEGSGARRDQPDVPPAEGRPPRQAHRRRLEHGLALRVRPGGPGPVDDPIPALAPAAPGGKPPKALRPSEFASPPATGTGSSRRFGSG